jgi:hypothetical protein
MKFYAEVTLFQWNFPPFNSAEFRAILCTEFRIWNLSNIFIYETLGVFVLKTKIEFKNIKFAFSYLNDPFGKNLCLKKW